MANTQISRYTYEDKYILVEFLQFPKHFYDYLESNLYIWKNSKDRKEKQNTISLDLFHTPCCDGESMSLGPGFQQVLCFLFVLGNMSSQLLLQMPVTCYLSSTVIDSNPLEP